MAVKLPKIPNEPIGENHSWREFFFRLTQTIVTTSSNFFTGLNFSGSNLTSIVTRNHNDLQSIQGGSVTDRQHLTTGQINTLGGSGTTTGYLTPPSGTTAAGTAPLKFAAGPLMTTPETGAFEFNAGHLYFTDGYRHVITSSDVPIIADTTVSNTIVETTIYSHTTQPNEFHADEVIKTDISGIYSNASAADDFTINFYIDTTLLGSVARVGGNVTNQGWRAEHLMTVRSIGASGSFMCISEFNDGVTNYLRGNTAPVTINTTIAHTFTVKVLWVNAKVGNTLTCQQGYSHFIH